ncbi:MAG: Zn-ribbon domain-containing OB-fold protein [Candidatus Thorarchaeota archaeon]
MNLDIEATKCEQCENVVIPPRTICPYCGPGTELSKVNLQSEGTIVSFTSLQSPPEGFDPPVVLALVELPQNATVLCLGSKEEEERAKIDSRVSLSKDSLGRFIFHIVE